MQKFNCPKCGQPMETADELTGQEVTCVSCGENFVPVKRPALVTAARESDNGNIRQSAKVIMGFAGVLAVIALLVFIGAIVEWRSDAINGHGEESAPFFAGAFWCLKAAIVFYVIAQITYIRANTEK